MYRRFCIWVTVLILICPGMVKAQHTTWLYWTLLPEDQFDEIVGEASGETAWNTVMETGGYNKNRPAEEYAGTFYEAEYIFQELQRYGLPGAEIVRFPGRKTWDGIKGELWETKPKRQKIASYRDMTAMLAPGSQTADVTAELVWVGRGSNPEIDAVEVAGKIVVTDGNISRVHQIACKKKGALGVVAISQSRPYFDPLQIPWRGISSRRSADKPATFGFYLPVREGSFLKERLLRKQKITVHAQVEAQMMPYELQNIICHIPGTDPSAGDVIFSAHLFEGYTKQGANDNKSGSAAILEIARVLFTLIEEGRLPRPPRTIRFLWGPEFSGTGPWVKANKDLMEKILCNINLDMVGEWLSLNQAFMCLMRTTFGNPHYINDVMENYYRYVGEITRERIHNFGVVRRIVAPTGADEPFYYSIENHFGASDHEVFNDWGVQVPGVMMIAWPDQWYHTSGDRVDKADPTQLKRVVAIGAAAAYTIANADDDMAVKIASEAASNGTRRLGQQLVKGLEALNQASAENLAEKFQLARAFIRGAVRNEKLTLDTVLELAKDKKFVGLHVQKLQKSMDVIGNAHLEAVSAHMQAVAKKIGVKPVKIQMTDLEKRAAKIIPRPTPKIKANGYGGYRTFINKVPREEKKKYPVGRGDIADVSELQRLVNGKNSILDIKMMLDAQYRRSSKLESIFNYLEILKLAGLIEI